MIAKRLFDLIISFLAIIILLPIFIIISLAIKISDGGSVIFKQERTGKNNVPFTLYKFRTMKINVNPFGKTPCSQNDHRFIKCGRFLREYSLDEIPQLFNVLKGEMSIVSPRPLFISQISELSEHHKKRLLVKPGITGLSQIYYRSSLISKESLDMEVEYTEKQNILLDIKIILMTIATVVRKKGVYK